MKMQTSETTTTTKRDFCFPERNSFFRVVFVTELEDAQLAGPIAVGWGIQRGIKAVHVIPEGWFD